MTCLATLRAQFGAALARKFETLDERLVPVSGDNTPVHPLRSLAEGPLIFRANEFENPDRVVQSCHRYPGLLEHTAAGNATGARAALERNLRDVYTLWAARSPMPRRIPILANRAVSKRAEPVESLRGRPFSVAR